MAVKLYALWMLCYIYLLLLSFTTTCCWAQSKAPVLSTDVAVVAFKGFNPSFTFSFNRTTYGPDARFYTTNSQQSITEKIPGRGDITHPLPSTFQSVVLGNFTYDDGNSSTNVYTATFTTPLLNESSSVLATLEAQVFLFQNATTYNFTLPRSAPKDDNNTLSFSLPLSHDSVVIFTRIKNWRFRDPKETLKVTGGVKASSGPLAVSFSKYGDPTNNLKNVVLRGGIEAVVVRLNNNATLFCGGVLRSSYVDISYEVTSYSSPIGAEISFSFPSFDSAFGNDTLALCGSGDNFIEYFAYMTLDNEDNPISWLLVGIIIAGGASLFCCLVVVVLVVRWQYNRIIARKDEREKQKEEEEKRREQEEEEEARRKLLAETQEKKAPIYSPGYYDYLLKKPLSELDGATKYIDGEKVPDV